jgi:ditrans,polycis-polyprenyl diphosphate synthase
VIVCGEIPEHIATIMDGNRRCPRQRGSDTAIDGHQEGAEKLCQVIEWLSTLRGVKVLTVSVFSIHNFNRPQDDIAGLMRLAFDTFTKIFGESAKFVRDDCAIRFIGCCE